MEVIDVSSEVIEYIFVSIHFIITMMENSLVKHFLDRCVSQKISYKTSCLTTKKNKTNVYK